MLALAVGVILAALAVTVPTSPEDVRDAYQRLFEASDDDGLRRLWAETPGAILTTIDGDLEGSLSAWEAQSKVNEAYIANLQSRAVWGARIGTEVTGNAIFSDYAAAFAGWDDNQKRSFREGQAAYGRARKALAATSRARLLYDQLGLASSELATLRTMVGVAAALERWPRALVSVQTALALAHVHADNDGVGQLLEQRAAIERALGLDTEAQATDVERAQLGK